jgi:hypothetical protein
MNWERWSEIQAIRIQELEHQTTRLKNRIRRLTASRDLWRQRALDNSRRRSWPLRPWLKDPPNG